MYSVYGIQKDALNLLLIIMAEYMAKLLNSTHPDRKHIEEVLKEYLFQSDESESDTEYMCDTESEWCDGWAGLWYDSYCVS